MNGRPTAEIVLATVALAVFTICAFVWFLDR